MLPDVDVVSLRRDHRHSKQPRHRIVLSPGAGSILNTRSSIPTDNNKLLHSDLVTRTIRNNSLANSLCAELSMPYPLVVVHCTGNQL